MRARPGGRDAAWCPVLKEATMPERTPAVVLVHGAFAESASWSAVIEELLSRGLEVVAAANPLRSVAGDAACVRDVISGIGRPVVLVRHSSPGIALPHP